MFVDSSNLRIEQSVMGGNEVEVGGQRKWRGKPVITHQAIVELIKAIATRTGLRVECRLDKRTLAKGRRISDEQLAKIKLVPEAFHGKWNYAIHPNSSSIVR